MQDNSMNLLKYITGEEVKEKSGAWFDDCKHIKDAAKLAGYEISTIQAHLLWDLYSQSYSAHWLGLPGAQEELKELLLSEQVYQHIKDFQYRIDY